MGFAQPGAWLQLAIVDRATGLVQGDAAVHGAADQPATAEVGVTLARGSQGRGIATEALSAVLDELFGAHRMHRVIAQVDDRNVAVQRLLDRLGFRPRGPPGRGGLVQRRVDHALQLRPARPRLGDPHGLELHQPGVGRREAAGVEVEGAQLVLEVDVEPFAARLPGVLHGDLDQAPAHAVPAGRHP